MVSDRAFIFHIYIPNGKTLSSVAQSRSSVKVKVKYQGHSFRLNDHCGGISVSQTQLVYFDFFPIKHLHPNVAPKCGALHSYYAFIAPFPKFGD